MPTLVDALLPEFDREMGTTRRLLERVPDDQFDWAPHARSMPLGRLSAHLTNVVSWGLATLTTSEFDLASAPAPAAPGSTAALLVQFDDAVAATRRELAPKTDAELLAPWSLKQGEHTIFTMPKAAVWRSFVLSHLIHHRGQLSVYLRLQEVPLPSIYGPSADEAPPGLTALARRVPFTPAPFQPWFAGGHRQTLFAWARRRHLPGLPPPEARYFNVAPDAQVLAHCHWHSRRHEHPALLLLHGLEGSSSAHYMRGIADKAWGAGWNVVRLNQRNCGGTEHLSRGLYHSGLTHDARVVIDELGRADGIGIVAVAGYSLGGNLALKLAGETAAPTSPTLAAVCAVSPTMDLARCVDALERRANLVYQWNFVRRLKARMRRKAAAFPGEYALEPLARIRTVRQFDEAYTAPAHGFAGAADYYHRASALRVADRIRTPTLVLTAADDPFVPATIFDAPEMRANPAISLTLTRVGGHCAFVEHRRPGYDGYWAEREIVRFITALANTGPPAGLEVPIV